ncbi:hypothetical protein [Dactylosporangium sp. NPDC048998]|uniref:hypothetical protein n=1 Tax=Dactylosporangium sp. NPDC048998 TaxID=3363976 RepID=UPI0037119BDC
MDRDGHHHVPRIDDTVTAKTLHERAEAVAVPDFHFLDQPIQAILEGLTRHHRREPGERRRT